MVQRLIKILLLALFAILCTAHAQRGDRLEFERKLESGFDKLELKKIDEAKIAFGEALKLQPDSAEATCYLGLAEYKSSNMLGAMEMFERALLLDEGIVDSPFLYYRALAARQIGLLSFEKRSWQDLINFNPDSRFAERGREALTGMAERQRFGPSVYFNKGREFAKTYPHTAILFFLESIEESLTAELPVAEYELPMSWLLTYLNRTRQPQEVLRMEEPVNAIDSGLENIYLQLAIARVSVGDCEEAEGFLGKVTEDSFPNAKNSVKKTCRDVRQKYAHLLTEETVTGEPKVPFRLEKIEPKLYSTLTELGEPENPAPSQGDK